MRIGPYQTNWKETTSMVVAGVVGAAAPIVGARYIFFGNPYHTTIGEALAWTGAVTINLFPLIIEEGIPIPIYTGGIAAGLAAFGIRSNRDRKFRNERRREEENRLERDLRNL